MNPCIYENFMTSDENSHAVINWQLAGPPRPADLSNQACDWIPKFRENTVLCPFLFLSRRVHPSKNPNYIYILQKQNKFVCLKKYLIKKESLTTVIGQYSALPMHMRKKSRSAS